MIASTEFICGLPHQCSEPLGGRGHSVDRSRPSLEGLRVLAIEDNEMIAGVVEAFLKLEGAVPLFAGTGSEGLNIARREHPDVILLDMDLPDLDGLTVAAELRQSVATRDIPVIATTGRNAPGDREDCLEAGCTDYVAKPFGLGELRDTIARALRTVVQLRDVSCALPKKPRCRYRRRYT